LQYGSKQGISYHDRNVNGRKLFVAMIVNKIQDEYEVAKIGKASPRKWIYRVLDSWLYTG